MTDIGDTPDPDSLVELIWQQQISSWKQGQLVLAETLFESYPELLACQSHALDVIFNEFAILSGDGASDARPEDYYRRFPQWKEPLQRQFNLFDTLNGCSFAGSTDLPEQGTAKEGGGDLLPNSTDRYEIKQELGRGATAIVYEAWDRQLQQKVALKKLHPQLNDSKRSRLRLMREARAVARLHHPGIVPIRDVCEVSGSLTLVSAFVDGRSLRVAMEEGGVNRETMIHWVMQVADALDYAHENGVVHRDVKPANILINENGRAMLTDFGLATNSNTEISITHTGDLIGTPAFMAPEQARADFSAIGPPTDVYSLGAVMYFMLSARLPFTGSFSNVMHRLLHEEPASLGELCPDLSRDLVIITEKSMRTEPGSRYASARELSDDLRRYRNGEVISARRISLTEKALRFTRNKPVVSSLIVVTILLLSFLAGSLLQLRSVVGQRNRAQQAESINRTLLANATFDSGVRALQQGQLKAAASDFEHCLDQGYVNRADVKLKLVECYLALGNLEQAVGALDAVDHTAATGLDLALVRYWQCELAARGVTRFGSVSEIYDQLDMTMLPPAKRQYLLGLQQENSESALKHFQNAIREDPYHHSARKMSLIMAFSLARFEDALARVEISRQLFPDDIDFQLINALLLSSLGRPEEGHEIVNSVDWDSGSASGWTSFCDFVAYVTRQAGGESIGNSDLLELADLFQRFAKDYQPLVEQRGWRFPPAIGRVFRGLPVVVNSLQKPGSGREYTRSLAAAHPEATVLTIAAENELGVDRPGTVDETRQLIAARDLFLQATGRSGFVDGIQQANWLGVFTTAMTLALVKQEDIDVNTQHFVLAAQKLNPDQINEYSYCKLLFIALVRAEEWELADRFAQRGKLLARSLSERETALWHCGLVQQHKKDWDSLLQTCDQALALLQQHENASSQRDWTGLQHRAANELNKILATERPAAESGLSDQ